MRGWSNSTCSAKIDNLWPDLDKILAWTGASAPVVKHLY
jgi:hypothetical protein